MLHVARACARAVCIMYYVDMAYLSVRVFVVVGVRRKRTIMGERVDVSVCQGRAFTLMGVRTHSPAGSVSVYMTVPGQKQTRL
jgi:hypothetical protein